MSAVSPTLTALAQTEKGRLIYDGDWFEKGKIRDLLDEFFVPPTIDPAVIPRRKSSSPEQHSGDGQVSSRSSDKDIHVSKNVSTEAGNNEILPGNNALLLQLDAEEQWNEKVQQSVEKKRTTYEKFWQDVLDVAQKKLQALEIAREQKTMSEFLTMKIAEENKERELLQKQQKLKDEYRSHARKLDAKLREAQLAQEQSEKLAEESKKHLGTLTSLEKQVDKLSVDIQSVLSSCKHAEKLDNQQVKVINNELVQLVNQRGVIVANVKANRATAVHVVQMNQLVTALRLLRESAEKITNKANTEGELKAAELAIKEKQKTDNVVSDDNISVPAKPKETRERESGAGDLSLSEGQILCVTESAYKNYENLKHHLEQCILKCKDIASNPAHKKLRFELHRAVNTPVNAISSISGTHLRSKIASLCNLLGGHTIEIAGRRVSVNDHPNGDAFAKNIIAQKLVRQGEGEVASKPEGAFPIAAVAVALWQRYGDLGALLLAHFHLRCPYLVPYYIPQQEGESQEDHYKSLGYVYNDGVIEKQDKFLNRMSGLVRLYAAILITPPQHGSHPHGIEHGWIWLSNIINLHPHPDISATVIYEFLQVAGFALLGAYGRQFQKLLYTICSDYFPKIEKVTPQGQGGPLIRLKTFLEKCIKTGSIPPPPKRLPSNFWAS